MLVSALPGIRLAARTQIGMAAIEYLILTGFSTWGLVAVLGHRAGTVPVARGWFSLSGIGGHGRLAAGPLLPGYRLSLPGRPLFRDDGGQQPDGGPPHTPPLS